METATSQAEQQRADESKLDAILGGEAAEPEATPAQETQDAEVAEEPAKTEEGAEEAVSDKAEEEVAADDEQQAGEAEEEESELSIEDSDRDYSESAYQKAAAHFSKTLKVQFDPNDPKDRVTLRELIARGEDFKRLQAEKEAKAATEEVDDKGAEAAKAEEEAPKPLTAEQISESIKEVDKYAESRVVPQVAQHLYTNFLQAMWPDEFASGDFKDAITPERAAAFTKVMTSGVLMVLRDQMPNIFGYVQGGIQQDPIYSHVSQLAVRERAFEYLDSQKDEAGAPKFPGLEGMVEKGTLQAVIKANPEIFNKKLDKDPFKDYARRVEIAYRIARGQSVDPKLVSKAVETGKSQEKKAAANKAAARVGPGKPKGTFGKPATADQELVSSIVSGGGSKFSRLVAEQTGKR